MSSKLAVCLCSGVETSLKQHKCMFSKLEAANPRGLGGSWTHSGRRQRAPRAVTSQEKQPLPALASGYLHTQQELQPCRHHPKPTYHQEPETEPCCLTKQQNIASMKKHPLVPADAFAEHQLHFGKYCTWHTTLKREEQTLLYTTDK